MTELASIDDVMIEVMANRDRFIEGLEKAVKIKNPKEREKAMSKIGSSDLTPEVQH